MTVKLLDREFQRFLLETAGESYPSPSYCDGDRFDGNDPKLLVNATYLEQHGLLQAQVSEFMSGGKRLNTFTLTNRGVDFLADDGGLGAILDVVTIRLEAETLRTLVAARIESSDLPKEEKSRLVKALEQLKKKGLEEMNSRLVKYAADQIADPETWRKLFDGLGKARDLLPM